MRSASSFLRGLARSSAPRLPPSPSQHIPGWRRLHYAPQTSLLTRSSPRLARLSSLRSLARCESTTSSASPQNNTSTTAPKSRLDRDDVPAYELTFTCKVCSTRSSHRISKQGYHQGTVLISCPSCKNRHLISDHLKIFSDKSITIEDIMRDKGSLVKRGTLGTEGDVEFWDDGTSTPRSSQFHPDSVTKPDSDTPARPLTEQPASEQKS